jgi:hypothetical protein
MSCFLDQISTRSTNRGSIDRLTDESKEILIDNLSTGKILLKGQVVNFKSTYGDDVLGLMPAVVTNVMRLNTTTVEYTLKLLIGDLSGDLTETTMREDAVPLSIDVEGDNLEDAVTSILDGKLGRESYYDVQTTLGVSKLLLLDLDDGVYKTWM